MERVNCNAGSSIRNVSDAPVAERSTLLQQDNNQIGTKITEMGVQFVLVASTSTMTRNSKCL